jgi:very-short-patch-repair endonuclease
MKGAPGARPAIRCAGPKTGDEGGRDRRSWRLVSAMRKETANSGGDRLVARIAGNQHGVIAAWQLRDAGLLPSRVADRVSAGRLHRIHRGVYAVGSPNLGNEGRWMAAVLACGKGAVLSHRSAAELWRIRAAGRSNHNGGPVDVTVPSDGGRNRRPEVRLHRSLTLSPADVTRRDGIPVTRPARTLSDLRRVLPRDEFARALREAEYLKLPIGDAFKPDRSRTDLEGLFLALARRHRLPQPEVNVRVDRYRVDFLWRRERLVVEVDGWDSHRTRSAFEEDRARDARLAVLGYTVLRFTWRQAEDDARGVARTIRELLRR